MIDLPPINKTIMVFAKILANGTQNTHSFDIDYEDTVEIIKGRLAIKSKVPAGKQRLIFKGRELKDGQPCIDIDDFSKEGNIHVVIIN